MSLPASGKISMGDIRTEFEQTSLSNYSFYNSFTTPWNGNALFYCPLNIHSDNNGKYPDTYLDNKFSDWYGYNNSAYYSPSDTFRNMFLNIGLIEGNVCYSSTMTVYDLGTSNKTYDLTVSGSAGDFTGVDYVRFYYGKPWNASGTNTGSNNTLVQEIYVNQSAYNNTYSYNYTYDSGKGQRLYCVVTAGCY